MLYKAWTKQKKNLLIQKLYRWLKKALGDSIVRIVKRKQPMRNRATREFILLWLFEGKHLTTHIFRHTHISMLSELGVPLKTIMQRVGHNDPFLLYVDNRILVYKKFSK